MGLQIDPPFFGSIRGSYNLSRLLGKMHRHAVMGKFLFDSKVFVDQVDETKNYFGFDFTPHITRFE